MRKVFSIVFALVLVEVVTSTSSMVVPLFGSSAVAAEITQDEAAARARKQTGGRVLSVEPKQTNGNGVFLVKVLLPDGTVRTVEVQRYSCAAVAATEFDLELTRNARVTD